MSEETKKIADGSDKLDELVSSTTWDCANSKRIDHPKDVSDFLAEVLGVCKKHGFSISHEDGHGAFEIVEWDESNAGWLGCAHYNVC